MKILIVGSRGFIGSHLASAAQRFGAVVCYNLSGTDGNADVSVRSRHIAEMFETEQPDVCVNCSGAAHVQNSFADPLNDFSRNSVDVYEMLSAINRASPNTRFVHLSSAAVYGNPTILPISETAALNPLSPYGFHKLAAEQFCRQFTKLYGTKTVSLRIFSTYGPGLRKQLLWDTFRKWKQQPEIELFGTGEETRDFIYISDLCEAILTIVQNAAFAGEAINVGSGIAVSVREIVSLLTDSLGGDKKISFVGQKREGDPDCWRADIGSLESLGFKIQTTIETGVRTTAQWQKEHG
ncbi:NAD-dependent epimerase/dehydratase family protein [Rhizobium panacihumi]|uniref:NAD-dependent epimerase/dehydratase family protein n=1 Tax=Rhizobium panacihumi TaxID=2008450 RepID=UPI003D790A16